MNDLFPKIAGINITRKCNLQCGYCSTRNNHIIELDEDQWIRAISILDQLGIEKLVILGGEPTIKPGMENVIRHLSIHTSIDFSIVSNGTADLSILKGFVNAGLKKFSASIDTLKGNSLDLYTTLKSQKALWLFDKLQAYGLESLTAYFVLSAMTMNQAVEIVEYLSARKIWLYILPYHYGKSAEDFWVTRDKEKKSELAITESNMADLTKLMEVLLEMKENGYLIANSNSFLRDLPSKIDGFTWHCLDTITELRIDADGSLMCCHDNRGDLSSSFTIFDIADEEKYREFRRKRAIDAKACPGCFWPSQYHSVELLKTSS